MIIRGIDHNQNVVICDGSEMLHDFNGLIFTYHGTSFKCTYDDNDETHIKWMITRRKYGGKPVIYYVNLLIRLAVDMTVDDMYYYILADCCDDNGVIK